jgi:hypothetical protein
VEAGPDAADKWSSVLGLYVALTAVLSQALSLAHDGRATAGFSLRHRIDEAYLIPVGGKPARVHTGATADIEHRRRLCRQQPSQDIPGPQKLQPASTHVQPADFSALGVMDKPGRQLSEVRTKVVLHYEGRR